MADKMPFNYNTEISMFHKGGYEAYVALIIILLRIANKCKPNRILMTGVVQFMTSWLTTKFSRKYEKSKL